MKVSSKDIFLDDEDRLLAVSLEIENLDKVYSDTSARWMWVNEEWGNYVRKKVQLKKELRKLKERLGYNTETAD